LIYKICGNDWLDGTYGNDWLDGTYGNDGNDGNDWLDVLDRVSFYILFWLIFFYRVYKEHGGIFSFL
jgi:hypothetical protein